VATAQSGDGSKINGKSRDTFEHKTGEGGEGGDETEAERTHLGDGGLELVSADLTWLWHVLAVDLDILDIEDVGRNEGKLEAQVVDLDVVCECFMCRRIIVEARWNVVDLTDDERGNMSKRASYRRVYIP
jgi:hypothetical protein